MYCFIATTHEVSVLYLLHNLARVWISFLSLWCKLHHSMLRALTMAHYSDGPTLFHTCKWRQRCLCQQSVGAALDSWACRVATARLDTAALRQPLPGVGACQSWDGVDKVSEELSHVQTLHADLLGYLPLLLSSSPEQCSPHA